MWLRATHAVRDMWEDRSAIAANEFAVIEPIMLVLFFGTVEFSSGVAIDRKVSLMARTLADLTSQSLPAGVGDNDFTNYFAASTGIMTPYATAPVNATISELYVDPNSLQARVQWSMVYQGGVARAVGSIVNIPAALAVGGTYLLFSEISYLYVPTVGYVMAKSGVTWAMSPTAVRGRRYAFSIPPLPLPSRLLVRRPDRRTRWRVRAAHRYKKRPRSQRGLLRLV